MNEEKKTTQQYQHFSLMSVIAKVPGGVTDKRDTIMEPNHQNRTSLSLSNVRAQAKKGHFE